MTHKNTPNYFGNRAILYKTYSLVLKFGIYCPELICHQTDISISASPK